MYTVWYGPCRGSLVTLSGRILGTRELLRGREIMHSLLLSCQPHLLRTRSRAAPAITATRCCAIVINILREVRTESLAGCPLASSLVGGPFALQGCA